MPGIQATMDKLKVSSCSKLNTLKNNERRGYISLSTLEVLNSFSCSVVNICSSSKIIGRTVPYINLFEDQNIFKEVTKKFVKTHFERLRTKDIKKSDDFDLILKYSNEINSYANYIENGNREKFIEERDHINSVGYIAVPDNCRPVSAHYVLMNNFAEGNHNLNSRSLIHPASLYYIPNEATVGQIGYEMGKVPCIFKKTPQKSTSFKTGHSSYITRPHSCFGRVNKFQKSSALCNMENPETLKHTYFRNINTKLNLAKSNEINNTNSIELDYSNTAIQKMNPKFKRRNLKQEYLDFKLSATSPLSLNVKEDVSVGIFKIEDLHEGLTRQELDGIYLSMNSQQTNTNSRKVFYTRLMRRRISSNLAKRKVSALLKTSKPSLKSGTDYKVMADWQLKQSIARGESISKLAYNKDKDGHLLYPCISSVLRSYDTCMGHIRNNQITPSRVQLVGPLSYKLTS
ncbi:uncharacterized protein CMU_040790 [Cryptosporidium muris RN66]|uniref:Uncharacterized protein n=1 Tax=Cryptosporidium muris (strain RN66) TaxID=441375 RepID=B6A9W9_CRYMR|nr:uncharacterized protein CMU_040790 [Cryptosporidium muris RN66]EEA05010.1 hypothetical protein CMU_040790 [Cryptosporidium muris RN66]|eukprot:XP_002139359.1 hypothetical protein [Cryptosporidium muris RN66]